VVYAHGTLTTSKCFKCGGKTPSEDPKGEVLQGNVPLCQKITGRRKRRRTEDVLVDGKDPAVIVIGTSLSVAPISKVIT